MQPPKMMIVYRPSALVALCAILLIAVPTEGADDDASRVTQVEQLAEAGRRAYEVGDFATAVSRYVEAFHIGQTPALLYNIAFIYDRKLGESDVAISYYRRYIESPGADEAVVKRALVRLEALEHTIEIVDDAPPRIESIPVAEEQPSKTSRLMAGPRTPSDAVDVPSVEQSVEQSHGGASTAAWLTLTGGVVVLGAGVAMGFLAARSSAAFEKSTDLQDKLALRQTGRNQAIAADVLMGTGVASVALGVLWVALSGTSADDSSASLHVHPKSEGVVAWLRWRLR